MLLLEGPKPEKSKRGRPLYEPSQRDRVLVEQLKACGITDVAISHILGINLSTLKRAFRMELNTACAKMVHSRMSDLVRIASRENGSFASVAASKIILEYMERTGVMVRDDSTSIPGAGVGQVRVIAEIPRNGRE